MVLKRITDITQFKPFQHQWHSCIWTWKNLSEEPQYVLNSANSETASEGHSLDRFERIEHCSQKRSLLGELQHGTSQERIPCISPLICHYFFQITRSSIELNFPQTLCRIFIALFFTTTTRLQKKQQAFS